MDQMIANGDDLILSSQNEDAPKFTLNAEIFKQWIMSLRLTCSRIIFDYENNDQIM